MNIIVLVKMVPDLVEELEIDSSGKELDRDWLKYKLSEFDDYALEEALLMKEAIGGEVVAIALDGDDVDKSLYTAAAKGADRVIKITGDFDRATSSHVAAKAIAHAIQNMEYDLVFTGVQAVDDRDGQVGVLLAHYLDHPHISVVTQVRVEGNKAIIHKEYGGGLVAEFESGLPLVLGIQASSQTPRYAPVSKVRRAMKSTTIEEVSGGDAHVDIGSGISRMFKPDTGGGAEILEGSPNEIADRILSIIKEKGIK